MAWAALIPLAISAVSAISGAAAKNKAKKERERLAASRPELGDSQYLDEQMDLARSELVRGNQTPGMTAMQQSMDSNFSSALESLLRSGGSPGNVASLYGNQLTGQMRMAVANDEVRRSNILNLMNAGKNSEQFRQDQFGFNRWHPWADSAQANSASLQAANQQMWSGIANAGSAGAYWAGAAENKGAYNDYFRDGRNQYGQ